MIKSFEVIMNAIANTNSRIHAVECELINYMESEPKSTPSDQWSEERLRALEKQVHDLSLEESEYVCAPSVKAYDDTNVYQEISALHSRVANCESVHAAMVGNPFKEIKSLRQTIDLLRADVDYHEKAMKQYEMMIQGLTEAGQALLERVAALEGRQDPAKYNEKEELDKVLLQQAAEGLDELLGKENAG